MLHCNIRKPPLSTEHIRAQIHRALAAAGLDTRTGVARGVLDTIEQALGAAGMPQRPGAAPPPSTRTADTTQLVIDVEGRSLDDPGEPGWAPPSAVEPRSGRFLDHRHTGPHGSRTYKLYVPSSYREGVRMPLIVMLHGCKQDPADFARGTRMNEVAEDNGLLVAYPAQSRKANGSNCWRWFERDQQHRGGAEPSIIVAMVAEIARAFTVDARRVYVAGLSAGGAMAMILSDTHPDVFAAAAAHSGLPPGAATDVPSAFAAMQGAAGAGPRRAVPPRRGAPGRAVPTIVFHGDADATVVPANGEAIASHALTRLEAERGPLARVVEQRTCQGSRCIRTTHRDSDGTPVVEHWTVQGAGHAWMGGSTAGSFATPHGPQASREMVRFFSLHTRPT